MPAVSWTFSYNVDISNLQCGLGVEWYKAIQTDHLWVANSKHERQTDIQGYFGESENAPRTFVYKLMATAFCFTSFLFM